MEDTEPRIAPGDSPQEPSGGHKKWDQMTPDARRDFLFRMQERYRGEPSNPWRFDGRNIEDLASSSYARLPQDLRNEVDREEEPSVGPSDEERATHAYHLQHPEEYMPPPASGPLPPRDNTPETPVEKDAQ